MTDVEWAKQKRWAKSPATKLFAETERARASETELLKALRDVFALIDDGFLVRDTSKDSDPLWALNSVRFVTRLAAAHAVIAKAGGTP